MPRSPDVIRDIIAHLDHCIIFGNGNESALLERREELMREYEEATKKQNS